MGALEDFPVSEMAKNMARRSADEAAALTDPIERVVSLIQSGNNGHDINDGFTDGYIFGGPEFVQGVRVAIKTLMAAGLSEEQLPIEGLKERVMEVSLGLSTLLEAEYQGDIANLYLEVDGGNG